MRWATRVAMLPAEDDVAKERPEVVERLRGEFAAWDNELMAPQRKTKFESQVGAYANQEAPKVARKGKRAAGAGNRFAVRLYDAVKRPGENGAGGPFCVSNGLTPLAAGAEVDYPRQVEFKAGRPFLFMIVHERTGAVLFMGRVVDPTAK